MYYLRTQAAADAIKFTVDTSTLKESNKENVKQASSPKAAPKAELSLKEREEKAVAQMVCSLQNRDECLMCGA